MAKPKKGRAAPQAAAAIEVDPYRAFVFPNRVREQRQRHGFPKLLGLAAVLPEIPYIRLSKIERGEIFARPDELRRIGSALGVEASGLLIDVEDGAFAIAAWAAPFRDSRPAEIEEERFAVLLGAALRARRTGDAKLTIAVLESDYALPPVILSRIENALKPFDRWNEATQSAIFRIFEVDDERALRGLVMRRHQTGDLDPYLDVIATPSVRIAKSRQRIAALRQALAAGAPVAEDAAPPLSDPALPAHTDTATAISPRAVPVYGSPLPGGLIAFTPTGSMAEAPSVAGPSSFGLRVCRATLGGGLPGHATVIVDPDRFPAAGGLGAVREGAGYRLVTVTLDREGRMKGYSLNPDVEVALDSLDPTAVSAVVAGLFV